MEFSSDETFMKIQSEMESILQCYVDTTSSDMLKLTLNNMIVIMSELGYTQNFPSTRANLIASTIPLYNREIIDDMVEYLQGLNEVDAASCLIQRWAIHLRLMAQKRAQRHWRTLRIYVKCTRPTAALLLEIWQKRVCAPNMQGRKRDFDAFSRDFNTLFA